MSTFVFHPVMISLGHGLLLRYCEVCATLFAPIVDDMLALELSRREASEISSTKHVMP
jgi:hypothetical protein